VRATLSAPVRERRGESPTTQSQLNAQDAYAFWIAGFVLLAIVLARAVRRLRPGLPVPRPTSAQLSTMVAWLIIVGVVLVVLLTRRR
jgi:tellurite resistance protein TehA-like permease